jgi:hypothetical protein
MIHGQQSITSKFMVTLFGIPTERDCNSLEEKNLFFLQTTK